MVRGEKIQKTNIFAFSGKLMVFCRLKEKVKLSVDYDFPLIQWSHTPVK